ncbi:MAG: HAD-IA family hydrolase [Oscillospiraceae bacterium]
MKNFDYIFFDLDGTITDSADGIINSFLFALEKFDIAPERQSLQKFVGPPLWESFSSLGLSQRQVDEALKQYQVYYTDTGIFENRVYDGVEALLKALKASGKKLVLASSKKDRHVKRVLEHFGLDGYFDFIGGSSVSDGRLDKKDVINYCLESLGIGPAEAVMVGDREHDILGARDCGLECIGVLYGYGTREELEKAGADVIVGTVQELGSFLGV